MVLLYSVHVGGVVSKVQNPTLPQCSLMLKFHLNSISCFFNFFLITLRSLYALLSASDEQKEAVTPDDVNTAMGGDATTATGGDANTSMGGDATTAMGGDATAMLMTKSSEELRRSEKSNNDADSSLNLGK